MSSTLPTVVFLPHFGGRRVALRRHQELFRSWGYQTVFVDLDMRLAWIGGPDNSLVPRWMEQLETQLDTLPGNKILFTFSYPSITVPALLSARPRTDIRAWITDGGPFLQLLRCQWNFFIYEQPIANPLRRAVQTALSFYLFGGRTYERNARHFLKNLNARLPILSLRAGADRLVPPSAIDKFFINAPGPVERQEFAGAGHLEGLKLKPDLYAATLQAFLKAHL